MQRRDFLKRSGVGMAGVAALKLFRPTQAAVGQKVSRLAPLSKDESAFDALREEYLLAPEVTYFNHASIGTIPKTIHEAHKDYLQLCETNPWLYMWSEPWEEARAHTRGKMAGFLGCSDEELAFTHNTTEGFNLLAHGLPLGHGDEVVFSSLNHPGASRCWFHYSESKKFSVKRFEFPIHDTPNLTRDDLIDIHLLQVSDKTRVLVLPHIDNVVGIRHPVREIAEAARSQGVRYIAVDAAQAVGMIPCGLDELGVDFYATSPHKWLQAPKGTGLLYVRKPSQQDLNPMWVTWGQDRWHGTVRIFEDYGTRNLAEVLTLGDAVDFQKRLGLEPAVSRRRTLWRHFQQSVEDHPKLTWRSPVRWELGSSLYAVEVSGKDSRELFEEMFRNHGFVFRPFHSENLNTVRLSLNLFNTPAEIDRFMELVS